MIYEREREREIQCMRECTVNYYYWYLVRVRRRSVDERGQHLPLDQPPRALFFYYYILKTLKLPREIIYL